MNFKKVNVWIMKGRREGGGEEERREGGTKGAVGMITVPHCVHTVNGTQEQSDKQTR